MKRTLLLPLFVLIYVSQSLGAVFKCGDRDGREYKQSPRTISFKYLSGLYPKGGKAYFEVDQNQIYVSYNEDMSDKVECTPYLQDKYFKNKQHTNPNAPYFSGACNMNHKNLGDAGVYDWYNMQFFISDSYSENVTERGFYQTLNCRQIR